MGDILHFIKILLQIQDTVVECMILNADISLPLSGEYCTHLCYFVVQPVGGSLYVYIKISVFAHSLICISYRTYEGLITVRYLCSSISMAPDPTSDVFGGPCTPIL
jgi:hypothetical protein